MPLSGAALCLQPLSFRPSHISPTYYVGSLQDAQRWGDLAKDHGVRLFVNCCATELGADVYVVDGVEESSSPGQSPPQQRVFRRPPHATPLPPPPQLDPKGDASVRHKRHQRQLLNSIRCPHIFEDIGPPASLPDRCDGPTSELQQNISEVLQWTLTALTEAPSTTQEASPTFIELLLPMKDDVSFPLLVWLQFLCPFLLKTFPLAVPLPISHPQPALLSPTPRPALPAVLIHCLAGVSRSVSVLVGVTALSIVRGNQHPEIFHDPTDPRNVSEAADVLVRAIIDWVRSRRRFASPNPGFVRQLCDYVEQLQRDHNVHS